MKSSWWYNQTTAKGGAHKVPCPAPTFAGASGCCAAAAAAARRRLGRQRLQLALCRESSTPALQYLESTLVELHVQCVELPTSQRRAAGKAAAAVFIDRHGSSSSSSSSMALRGARHRPPCHSAVCDTSSSHVGGTSAPVCTIHRGVWWLAAPHAPDLLQQ